MPGRVDHGAGTDNGWCLAASDKLDPVFEQGARAHRRAEGDHAAMILQLALQGEEIAMAVEDAGDGRADCSCDVLAQRWLDFACRCAGNELKPFDPVRLRPGHDGAKTVGLIGMGDDQLSAILVGDTMRVEIGVEGAPSAHAETTSTIVRHTTDVTDRVNVIISSPPLSQLNAHERHLGVFPRMVMPPVRALLNLNVQTTKR